MVLDSQNTNDVDRPGTLGAVAAIFSAFFVFVLGGAIVLSVWVGKRDAHSAAQQGVEAAVEAPTQTVPKISAEAETAAPKVAVKTQTSRPSGRTGRKKTQRKTTKPRVAKTPKSAKVSKSVRGTEQPEAKTGEGLVMVVGGASRVRLMGAKGTFGPGMIPAGSYTIQATFEGGDPRMAGTVEVSNGDRLQLICAVSTQRCSKR